jgi:hypothetical protein
MRSILAFTRLSKELFLLSVFTSLRDDVADIGCSIGFGVDCDGMSTILLINSIFPATFSLTFSFFPLSPIASLSRRR